MAFAVKNSIRPLTLSLVALSLCLETAQAMSLEIWEYLKKYQVGIEKTVGGSNQITATYETPYYFQDQAKANDSKTKCVQNKNYRYYCETALQAGTNSGWGIYLQQPFKRQGLFYFDWNFGLSLQGFQSEIPENMVTGTPIRTLKVDMYGIIPRFYLRAGFTPKGWFPDIFVSGGKQVQFVGGQVSLNGKSEWTFLTNRPEDSFYGELEVVFFRPKQRGEIEAFFLFSDSGSNYLGYLYPKEVDGIREMHAKFSQISIGLRVLLP